MVSSNRAGLFCTISGWAAAFLLLMYGLSYNQNLYWQSTHSMYDTPRLGNTTVKTAPELLKVVSPPGDHGCNGSRIVNLHQMVGVLEERLELLKNEPGQKWEKICSTQFAQACRSDCSRPLSPCPYKRLSDLFLSPKLTLTDSERQTILSIADSVPEADIIFLSAASSNHYNEMQALYHNLHTTVFPHIKNFQAVLVDLGLSRHELELSKKNCQCKVIPFPINKLPSHCGIKNCYSWKPLIVRALMEKARKHLVYMDASIRWRSFDNFTEVLNRTITRGLQFVRFDTATRVPVHTLKQTFDYFGWEPCAFDGFPELEGSIGVYKKDALVTQAVLEPWAKCALQKSCICPMEPGRVISCGGNARNHRCHRFDQSVLTMLSARTFGSDMNKFVYHQDDYNGGKHNALDIQRGNQKPGYFTKR